MPKPVDSLGRSFRLRVLANAIARHVEAGEWASHGQLADVVEELTGHHTSAIAVGSALSVSSDGGYVAFRIRSKAGRFLPFDHERVTVTAAEADLHSFAEGIIDENGDARSERRLATPDLVRRARPTVELLLAAGAT